jgi:hypothetical protein
MTVPGITQIDPKWADSWYWSFTERSARRLLEEFFPPSDVDVETHGNVLAAMAFLEGIASDELHEEELEILDASYPVCVAIRAVKRPLASGPTG